MCPQGPYITKKDTCIAGFKSSGDQDSTASSDYLFHSLTVAFFFLIFQTLVCEAP